MDSTISTIYHKLKEVKLSIDVHKNYFSDGTIIKIDSTIQELINYIDKKYNNEQPENKIKNYIKLNSTHPDCICFFLVKDENELMEISFIKGGCYYYVEYFIKKINTHNQFIKIKDKIVNELCDDWYTSDPIIINNYHIILTLEELVADLNKY
jgi:hypothetical protein